MFLIKNLIPQDQLENFCNKNYIVKLSVFGSALKENLKENSDIDILVEFEKNNIPGLFDIAGMELELSDKIGRKVDLRTKEELSRYFRDTAIEEAKVEYLRK